MDNLINMTTEELRALNHKVCAILKARSTAKASAKLQELQVGQLVDFKTGKGSWAPTVVARIITLNIKTASVQEVISGKRWRVHASLLTPHDGPVPSTLAVTEGDFFSKIVASAGLTAGQKAAQTRARNRAMAGAA